MYPPGTNMLTISFLLVTPVNSENNLHIAYAFQKLMNSVETLGDTECVARSTTGGYILETPALGRHYCVLDSPGKRKDMVKAYKRALKYMDVHPEAGVQMKIESTTGQLRMQLDIMPDALNNQVPFKERMNMLANDAR